MQDTFHARLKRIKIGLYVFDPMFQVVKHIAYVIWPLAL